MKYIFNLFNIICLTASMFLLAEIIYKYTLSTMTNGIDASYKNRFYEIVLQDTEISNLSNITTGAISNVRQSDKAQTEERKTNFTDASSSVNGKYSRDSLSATSSVILLRNHYDIIHKRDIFRTGVDKGESKDKSNDDRDSISEQEIAALEKTELKLKLWGTIIGSSGEVKLTSNSTNQLTNLTRFDPASIHQATKTTTETTTETTKKITTETTTETTTIDPKFLNLLSSKVVNDKSSKQYIESRDLKNYAVIETEKDKKQMLYREGDIIEGAVIKKIFRFSVVLSLNGKDERLEMTEEHIDKNSKNVESSNKSGRADSDQNGETDNISIKRSLIEESMKDINGLMSQVRVRPHFTGGNADGILLYGIKQSSMFKEMGIQNGDIIMGVDGKEIRSVEDAITLYDRLKNSSDVKMKIRRRGQEKEILYHVE